MIDSDLAILYQVETKNNSYIGYINRKHVYNFSH